MTDSERIYALEKKIKELFDDIRNIRRVNDNISAAGGRAVQQSDSTGEEISKIEDRLKTIEDRLKTIENRLDKYCLPT